MNRSCHAAALSNTFNAFYNFRIVSRVEHLYTWDVGRAERQAAAEWSPQSYSYQDVSKSLVVLMPQARSQDEPRIHTGRTDVSEEIELLRIYSYMYRRVRGERSGAWNYSIIRRGTHACIY